MFYLSKRISKSVYMTECSVKLTLLEWYAKLETNSKSRQSLIDGF
jgi:hypothetical protein